MSGEGEINIRLGIYGDLQEITRLMTPDQIQALMQGVAKVMAASSPQRAEREAGAMERREMGDGG